MRRMTRTFLLMALASLLAPATAQAQQRSSTAPRAGDMAVTGNLGFANAFDSDFDGLEPAFTGTYEYYTSPAVSWRGLLGLVEFDGEVRGSDIDAEVMFVNANVVYNWDRGRLHPYVTGGIGVYDHDFNGPGGRRLDGDIELGFNGGGGLDLHLESNWAIKFEGTFHGVTGDGPDTFFLGTVGAKFWF